MWVITGWNGGVCGEVRWTDEPDLADEVLKVLGVDKAQHEQWIEEMNGERRQPVESEPGQPAAEGGPAGDPVRRRDGEEAGDHPVEDVPGVVADRDS